MVLCTEEYEGGDMASQWLPAGLFKQFKWARSKA